MKEFVIQLSHTHKETLGTVRTNPYLQVAIDGEWIWIRGIEVTGGIDVKIRQLPAIYTFELDDQNNLFPPGGLTPVGKLPPLEWMSVREFITPQLPTSAMPAKISEKYKVKLIPSTTIKPGQALLTTLDLWKKFADAAPEVRLKSLRFVVSAMDEVLIMGSPLPTIPGKEYWVHDTLLLPGGFDFEIPLISNLVAGKLNPSNDSLILFRENSQWEKIPKAYVVPATRSAVRLIKGEEKA